MDAITGAYEEIIMSLLELDKYANYIIIASNESINVENIKSGKSGIMEIKGKVTRIMKINYPSPFSIIGGSIKVE